MDATGNESDKAVLNTSTSTRTPEEVLASGAALYTANCSSCHGDVESNTFNIQKGISSSIIRTALDAEYIGLAKAMNSISPKLNNDQLADLAAYIKERSPEKITGKLNLDGVMPMDLHEQLYKACLILAHRIPTQEELDNTVDPESLATTLENILNETTVEQSAIWDRGFSQFLFTPVWKLLKRVQ